MPMVVRLSLMGHYCKLSYTSKNVLTFTYLITDGHDYLLKGSNVFRISSSAAPLILLFVILSI